MSVLGRVSSFQSLGTVDGPGVRTVVFMQGCPLKCICCHNPETKSFDGGQSYSAKEMFEKILRFRNYFGNNGGVTFSGGEPLMQTAFLIELCRLLKSENIHIALDTSGCVLNEQVKELLGYIDLVLLDIKYPTNEDYEKYAGMSLDTALEFLSYLNDRHIKTTLRQVTIPDYTDSESSVLMLKELREKYTCIKKIELLPFHNLCLEKYENMGLEFRLKDTAPPSAEKMLKLNSLLN